MHRNGHAKLPCYREITQEGAGKPPDMRPNTMDNHQLGFADVKEAVRSRRLSSMGFGGLVALCAGIPVVNFFVVPAAVVGATLLWVEELDQ